MNLSKHLATTSLLAIALAAGMGSAQAAEDNADFKVSIVIQESCTISATAMDFDSHTRSTSTPVTQGTLTVNCSEGTPYQIGLDAGIHAEGTERRMANGSILMPYGLYRDASYTQNWGNDAANMKDAVGTASNQAHTVYGRVPSTNFPAGTYVDTVTARVVY